MTVRTFDRWLDRACHALAGLLFLVICGAVSYAAGTLAAPQDWPYDVIDREIVSDQVPPGGDIAMRRRIDYHQEDCWRQYDRRVVSQVQDGPQPGRVERFDPIIEQRLPVDLSGKWQTWAAPLPVDFPCGRARLIESVSAACTWWQQNIRLLRKPDIITPFTVTCPRSG